MTTLAKDKRYSIRREYCGEKSPRWVVRFCGEWVGKATNKHDAGMVALAHVWSRQDAIAAMAAPLN